MKMWGLPLTRGSARVDYRELRQKKEYMRKTTRNGLQARQSTPLTLTTAEESFNSTSLQTPLTKRESSKPVFHSGSGYNSRKRGGLSAHNVFVLDVEGKPLTPTTNAKARKLIRDKQAKPIWNKFSQFGIQMLAQTREGMPKFVLGCDWGTKFEGLSVVSETNNNLNVMWKLPNKKTIVNKLEERRQLRRARRWRNCRRRECRFGNRGKKGFIAPSQLVIVQSRLKAMQELLKGYPIRKVVIEDVKFNHKKHRWGKNFSTVEVGKNKIYEYLKKRFGKRGLKMVKGYDTFKLLEKYGFKKNKDKSKEDFYTHNIDSFMIASEQFKKEQKGFSQRIANKINEDLIIADDTYRPTRRRLHDTKFSDGNIRYPYSTGNFRGIRKGAVCEFGQIVGGTGNCFKILPFEEKESKEKRISKSIKQISWFSHNFKIKEVMSQFPTATRLQCPLAT
ncbi:RRXRR domain-containing protein [Candidatus Woesearchaeota archaeon]|nr:RRXRR domain-containing protein [Candidatus Woesearchaeota archaeon]